MVIHHLLRVTGMILQVLQQTYFGGVSKFAISSSNGGPPHFQEFYYLVLGVFHTYTGEI